MTTISHTIKVRFVVLFHKGYVIFYIYILVARYIVHACARSSYSMSSAHYNRAKKAAVEWLTIELLGSICFDCVRSGTTSDSGRASPEGYHTQLGANIYV